MLAPVNRDHVEPGILLEQQRHILGALYDLHGVRRVDRSQQTKRQAASGVVAVLGRVVTLPVLFAPGREGKLGNALLTRSVLGDVGNIRPLPDAVEIRLAISEPGRRTGRNARPLSK